MDAQRCKSNVLAQSAIELASLNSAPNSSGDAPFENHGNTPKRLGFVDRYLTVWIFGAMLLGIIIGNASPASADQINSWSTGNVNWPIAVGLIIMMFPPLARVNYDEVWRLISSTGYLTVEIEDKVQYLLEEVTVLLQPSDPKCGNKCLCHEKSSARALTTSANVQTRQTDHKFKQMLGLSLFINWIVGPFLMLLLGLIWLPDKISYIRGLVMVGLARCIAMVIVWNDLAFGSPEFAAILVCLNSLFQILFYSPYAYLFLSVILPACNLPNTGGENVSVSFGLVAASVGIYLGIPFAIGFGSWVTCNKLLTHPGWKIWYKTVFIPRTAPLTLVALLFTIIIMFVLKGHLIVSIPLAVLRVSLPLCSYFGLMFVGVYYVCHRLGYGLEETITLSFTSASNNFELAIAVSIAVFGLDSAEAFVGVIGPLVEVPVMLGFVHLVQVLHRRWPTVSHAHRSSITSVAGNEVVDADGTDVSRAVDCEMAVSPLHAKNVLFLCTGNSCRSHMAQGWCWYYHPHITAYSAGTAPTPGKPGTINPLAMQVMLEFGIDLSGHRSKHIQDLSAVDFALVVTVCDDAAQECPTFTPTLADAKPPRIVHHAFDDPPRLVGAVAQGTAQDTEQQLQVYRRVCEEIRDFVRDELPTLLM